MRRLFILAIVAVAVLYAGLRVSAQTEGLSLSWWTSDGGGGTWSVGDSFGIGASIGQPDTGGMSGGEYSLKGGFWRVMTSPGAPLFKEYLPMVSKQAQ
jgi:hypothetical protein